MNCWTCATPLLRIGQIRHKRNDNEKSLSKAKGKLDKGKNKQTTHEDKGKRQEIREVVPQRRALALTLTISFAMIHRAKDWPKQVKVSNLIDETD